MMKTRITMQELANLAGVSRGTVSRALSGSPLVQEKTRQKIHELAAQNNYKVNQQARNFRLGTTGVISVVFMQDEYAARMSDPFILKILGSIADCLSDHDLDVLLAHTPVKSALDLVDGRVFEFSDGVIFVGQGEQHEQLNEIARLDKPMVVWGAPVDGQLYTTVGSDNLQGGYLATKHLLEQGRKRVAYFGDISSPEAVLRYQGYQQALSEQNISHDTSMLFQMSADVQSLDNTIRELLAQSIGFDAVFCSCDLIALAAISAMNEIGINVPKDVAVVGYDDITTAKYNNPSLTTVKQDTLQGGRKLVDTLLAISAQNTVSNCLLPTELIVRQSSTLSKA